MFRNFTLILIFFIIYTSCTPKQHSNSVTISGRILNHSTEKDEIELHTYPVLQNRKILKTTIDSLGNFKFHFNTPTPIETELVYQTTITVLAAPSDSLFIEFNGKQKGKELLRNIKIKGTAAKLNSDIVKLKQMFYTDYVDQNKMDYSHALIQLNLADFNSYLDTMQNDYNTLIQKFSHKHKPCKQAIDWGRFYLSQNVYEAVSSYIYTHRFENSNKPAYWSIPVQFYNRLLLPEKISPSIYYNSKTLPHYINKYRHLYAFFNLLADEAYKQKKAPKGFIHSVKMNDSIEFAGLMKYTPDPLLKQLVLLDKYKKQFDALKLDSYEKNQQLILPVFTSSFLKKVLEDSYHITKQKLENPQISSTAILKALENSSAKQIMDEILGNHKGKVIYIDCWGDRCGPCLAELPNSKQLEEEMKGEKVEFVYVCLSSRKKVWKAIIAKHQLKGHHYFLNKQQSEEWMKAFNITGIPYYFLIDQHNTIIENGSYLRPKTVKTKILKLLAK
ncbi:TlpA family protein disulfide reductase [Prolixibacteraceae bacterium JC049]|nr:TlpA family protein disulfide reductase [Prolixibacteraceae bacterium JC049]